MGIRSCLREKQECLEAHFSRRCMICSFTDNYNEIAVFFFHLILSYGLYRKMECYRSHPASAAEMTAFHSEDYINFLSKMTYYLIRNHVNLFGGLLY